MPNTGFCAFDHPVNHRQCDFVTAFIKRAFAAIVAIARGRDVGRAACQQDSVKPSEQLRQQS